MASPNVEAGSEEPPAKRRRGEDVVLGGHSAEDYSAVRRSSEFWFQDGNIVIIASGDTAFRVHLGVLARHSPVFEDMFKVPQPADEDGIDGCPIMHVSDPPLDFDMLLQVLYEGAKTFQYGGRVCLGFSAVAAIVELGHKYQIDHLCAEGLKRMKTCFCHSFSVMQSTTRFGQIALSGGRTEMVLQSPALQVRISRDAIRAVNLARLVGEDSMLPMALYLCTLLPIATLLSSSASLNEPQNTLSTPDLTLCLEARTRLSMRACHRLERLWSHCFPDKCPNPGKCSAVRDSKSRARRQQRIIESPPSLFDNLGGRVRSAKADGLCDPCIQAAVSRQVEEMRFMWERLPEDLGLEIAGWNTDATPAP